MRGLGNGSDVVGYSIWKGEGTGGLLGSNCMRWKGVEVKLG